MSKNLSNRQLKKHPWQLRKIRHKLLLAFTSINLVLIISIGSLSYFSARDALRNEAFAGIEALRETRAEQILLWFKRRQRDVQLLSENPTLVTLAVSIINSLDDSTNAARTRQERLQDIIKLYRHHPNLANAGDNSVYSAIHNRVHPFFQEILAVQGYTDILIISPTGDIVYTINKLDDFGVNVLDGPYPQLAGMFQQIAETDYHDFTTFTDVIFYEPANQTDIFFGSPIFNNDKFIGALLIELPISSLNNILKLRQGLGETGETYIVGNDMLFRSDSRFLDKLNVETTILNENFPVDTEAGRSAFHGHPDTRIITSYLDNEVVSTWKPLALQPPTVQNPAGIMWALIVEKDTAEVDKPANELLVSIVLLTIAASIITFGGAYAISSQISNPIQRLTEAAKRIIDGQLDQQVEIITQDEVGTLAYSFNIMTAQLRELIRSLEQRLVDLNQAQEALRKSEALLNATQQLSKVGGWEFNAETGEIFWTEETYRIHEIPEDPDIDHIQESLKCYIPEDRPTIYGAFQRAIEKGEAYDLEFPFTTFKGKHLWIRTTAQPVCEKGKVVHVIGNIMDITELKRAEKELKKHRDHLEELVRQRTAELEIAKEQAEAASHAKSTFLANMSHELRTPLNAILGYAQILQQRPLDAEVIDALNTVQRSGEHLLTLITDILDIAKIEAGRIELFPTQIYFPTFLQDIASIIGARARAKNLSFSFEAIDPLPTGVQADETRLRQILLNLLGNAVKFTDKGQVTLRVGNKKYEVRSKGEKQQGDPLLPTPRFASLLRFEVADTGPGILPDQLERIFQPFEQVGEVTRRREGTGLGLTVSRQLVELMGGELHVESPLSLPSGGGNRERGPGSLFWFEVALPAMEVAVEPAQPSERVITGYTGPRCTVLVVDDIASNRAVLVNLLEPLGFEVFEAADGEQAIHLAREIRPNLILMDRWMPVLDGLEAMRQIRQNPELAEVPIIAVSASVSKEDQARSQEVGYDDFLPKPIHWPDLAAMLAEHLDLEWSYSEEKEEGIQPSELAPPPQEELAILLDLARRGNIRAIRERVAHIETLGEQYVAFARRLHRLAQDFEEQEILALVEQYMEKNQ